MEAGSAIGVRGRCSVPWLHDRPLWLNSRVKPPVAVRVPVGVDPGFQHNVGLVNLGQTDADRLIAHIDRAPAAMARAAIGSPWETPMFRRHLSGAAEGDWPVASIEGTKIAEAVGQALGTWGRSGRPPVPFPVEIGTVRRCVPHHGAPPEGENARQAGGPGFETGPRRLIRNLEFRPTDSGCHTRPAPA